MQSFWFYDEDQPPARTEKPLNSQAYANSVFLLSVNLKIMFFRDFALLALLHINHYNIFSTLLQDI